MLHDFAVGPRYAVFFVSPVENRHPARDSSVATSFGSLIRWKPKHGTEVIVCRSIDRRARSRWTVRRSSSGTSQVCKSAVTSSRCTNIRYDDFTTFEELAGRGRHRARRAERRAVIDPIARTMKSTPIWDGASEFPVLDPRFEGCGYREAFVVSEQGERRALARIDLKERQGAPRDPRRTELASEVVFVPRDASAPEGDGWGLSLISTRSSTRAIWRSSTPRAGKTARSRAATSRRTYR